MNKLFLTCAILGLGAMSFGRVRWAEIRALEARRTCAAELQSATNRLSGLESGAAAMRKEIQEKKRRLQAGGARLKIDPVAIALLSGKRAQAEAKEWAQLRELLEAGWNDSDTYVFVNKQALRHINFEPFDRVSRSVFAVTAEENEQLEAAREQAMVLALGRVQRLEPTRDIVAHYLIPIDPASQLAVSNNYVAALREILGPERGDLIQNSAWNRLRSNLPEPAPEPAEFIVRRTVADGQPDLRWEFKAGNLGKIRQAPVRYAQIPGDWFTRLFPGGWETLARQEGFELSAKFRQRPSH